MMKTFFLAAFLLCICLTNNAMEEQLETMLNAFVQKNIEKKEFVLLEQELKTVMHLFHTQGWRIPRKITFNYATPPSQQYGHMATNVTDTITLKDRFLKHFTLQEAQFNLGHELAHMALPQHSFLNPHNYLDFLTHPLAIALIATPILSKSYTFSCTSKPLRALATSIVGSFYIFSNARIRANRTSFTTEEYKYNSFEEYTHHHYSILDKVEEIECDIIAALTIPNGAKHGISFFEKLLALEGENPGKTHPKTSTRIKYLKAIQWLQEHGIRKHT